MNKLTSMPVCDLTKCLTVFKAPLIVVFLATQNGGSIRSILFHVQGLSSKLAMTICGYFVELTEGFLLV